MIEHNASGAIKRDRIGKGRGVSGHRYRAADINRHRTENGIAVGRSNLINCRRTTDKREVIGGDVAEFGISNMQVTHRRAQADRAVIGNGNGRVAGVRCQRPRPGKNQIVSGNAQGTAVRVDGHGVGNRQVTGSVAIAVGVNRDQIIGCRDVGIDRYTGSRIDNDARCIINSDRSRVREGVR